jgi:transcription elongation factor GreA
VKAVVAGLHMEDGKMEMDRVPMTREGYDAKKAELAALQSRMMEVTKRVAAARDLGDLSENAEYHAAREDQGMVQAHINELNNTLARAFIIDPNNLPKDRVVFGATVKVLDLGYDEEETFTLVGPGQDNPSQNRILTTSPIGQGLLGKKLGEIAEVNAPSGIIKFKILDITFGS